MSPHSSTRESPSDQCSRGASSIPGHLGPSIQCGRWPGLSLLQSTANSRGRQNRQAAGRWGAKRESDMDAGDSWARGLLVRSRTLPRSSSVRLIWKQTTEPYTYMRDALILCNQMFKLSQEWHFCSCIATLHFWYCLTHGKINNVQTEKYHWIADNTLTLSSCQNL